jgi:hypothetical protein
MDDTGQTATLTPGEEGEGLARCDAEQAVLDSLPPVPSAELALRTAVEFANRAVVDFEDHAYTSAAAAAALSQAWTNIAWVIGETQ